MTVAAHISGASAAPVCNPSNPSNPSKASKGVLVEVEQRTTVAADKDLAVRRKLRSAKTTVALDGSWTTEIFDPVHPRIQSKSGCLQPEQLAGLRDELLAAPWTLHELALTCHTDAPRFTVFKVKQKAVFSERPCPVERLDKVIQHAIDLLLLLVPLPKLVVDDDTPCLDNPLAKGWLLLNRIARLAIHALTTDHRRVIIARS